MPVSLNIAVPKETFPGERRVAAVPETVKRLSEKGFEVSVEKGAGENALFADGEYEAAGAKIEPSLPSLLSRADVVLKVRKPERETEMMKEGSALIAFLEPSSDPQTLQKLAERKITAFAIELMPRIARAQKMDALTSMSNLSGYKSVLLAAGALGRFFPMLMTAAGTIAPAKVLVLGGGVAGLQAAATAKRLGAVVELFDTRPAVKDQAQSLGVKFVDLGLGHELAEEKTGYAKMLPEEFLKKEREVISERLSKADAVISTALIPGKKAPVLITRSMVKTMKRGSVIVDLAAEQGGNCELSVPGKEAAAEGVTVIALTNIPSLMPEAASRLYSRNLENFLLYLSGEKGLKTETEDEIVRGTLVAHGGKVLYAS